VQHAGNSVITVATVMVMFLKIRREIPIGNRSMRKVHRRALCASTHMTLIGPRIGPTVALASAKCAALR
jgi:hypothetical protein